LKFSETILIKIYSIYEQKIIAKIVINFNFMKPSLILSSKLDSLQELGLMFLTGSDLYGI